MNFQISGYRTAETSIQNLGQRVYQKSTGYMIHLRRHRIDVWVRV